MGNNFTQLVILELYSVFPPWEISVTCFLDNFFFIYFSSQEVLGPVRIKIYLDNLEEEKMIPLGNKKLGEGEL